MTGESVPVTCAATAANANDTLAFTLLVLATFTVTACIRTVFGAKPHIHKRGQPRRLGHDEPRWPVERSNAWLLETRRCALRYDPLGFVIQSPLQAACIFLVAGRLVREI